MSISVPNVIELLYWLTAQVRRCRSVGLMTLSVAAGVAGPTLTLLSLWGLIRLIGLIGSGKTAKMDIVGIEISLPAHAELLIAAAGAGMVAGGITTYCSDIIGLKVVRRLMDHIRCEVAYACRDAASDRALLASKSKSVTSMLQVTTRECGMASVQLLRLPVALCTGGICISILAITSPITLLALLAITPIYCLVLNKLNRHSHRLHDEHSKLASPARQELTAAYGVLDRGHVQEFDPMSLEPMPDLNRSDDIMLGRIKLVRAVTLLNSITTVLVIIVLIAMMGSGLLGLGEDWATLLALIIVIRFLAGSIQRISVAIHIVSRFTEPIQLAKRIQSHDHDVDAVDPSELPSGLVILSSRVNRLQVIQGLLELAAVHPILKQCTIAIDLDHPGSIEDTDRAVVRDANAVQSETHSLGELPIVLASRTVQAVEAAEQRGFKPAIAADLRTEPPTVQPWDQIVEQASSPEPLMDEMPDEDLDGEDLADDF